MKRRIVAAVAISLATVVAIACQRPAPPPAAVVLMIGDGMGFPQIAMARVLRLGTGGRLAFEDLPVTGLVSTWSASNPTTDSGAAATAMAAAVKTDNQFVGLDAAGRRVETLAEAAQRAGWRVGYVTTTSVTHATPAGFYAHVGDRYADEAEIAVQLLAHAPDLALGGGRALFEPRAAGGGRDDGRDLLAEARAAGFEVVTAWPPPAVPGRKLLGVFAPEHLPMALDRALVGEEKLPPDLAAMTGLALDTLAATGDPFFLLVEGGRIDHGGHVFDGASVAAEVAGFDAAFATVEEFRREHPRMLVIVTADHATGGLAINDYVDWHALARQDASYEWMTRAVREHGAGPELVARHTGLEVEPAVIDAMRAEDDERDAARRLGRALAARHGVTWIPRVSDDTWGHTGEDVPVYAAGPGAERFRGVLDNTDVALRLAELMGLAAEIGPPAGAGLAAAAP